MPEWPTVAPEDMSRCSGCARPVCKDKGKWVHWSPLVDRDHVAKVSDKDEVSTLLADLDMGDYYPPGR